jgi:hypothetical protein
LREETFDQAAAEKAGAAGDESGGGRKAQVTRIK